jgi:hypothetical protein
MVFCTASGRVFNTLSSVQPGETREGMESGARAFFAGTLNMAEEAGRNSMLVLKGILLG